MATTVDIAGLRDAASLILDAKTDIDTNDLPTPSTVSVGDGRVRSAICGFAVVWKSGLDGLLDGIDQYSARLASAANLYAQADGQYPYPSPSTPVPHVTPNDTLLPPSDGGVSRGMLGGDSTVDGLIPGSPAALFVLSSALSNRAEITYLAWTALDAIEWDGVWTGAAAASFLESYEKKIPGWVVASEAHTSAANAIADFADALATARASAGSAIDAWARGDESTAKSILRESLAGLDTAASRAVASIDDAADRVTELDLFWSELGSVSLDVLINIGNAAASVANTVIEHPEDLLAILAGSFAVEAGIAGEAGGIALDATGVGAFVGVPVNVAAAGLVVAGGAAVGAGVFKMIGDSVGDSRVEPFQRVGKRGTANSEEPSTQGKSGGTDEPGQPSSSELISKTDLSPEQSANLERYIGKLPRNAEAPVITRNPDGSVQFSSKVPGRVPDSFATYDKVVDSTGKTVGYSKTTVAPDGELIHTKDKFTQ